MKPLYYLLFSLLILVLSFSCKKEPGTEIYNYKYSNDYIRNTVMIEINKGIIGNKHRFVINNKYLEESEINTRISSIQKEDIISINFTDKSEYIEGSYPEAPDGIVKINYYIDIMIKPAYYNIDNQFIMEILNELINKQLVVRFPLIVLDGMPLRGSEIKTYLDNLYSWNIEGIYLVDLDVGLDIWGESAINGVIWIETIKEKKSSRIPGLPVPYLQKQ